MGYSQTAKDITEEKISVLDGLCAEGFFLSSLNSIAHHPFSLTLILSISSPPSLIALLIHEKKTFLFCCVSNYIKVNWDNSVTWYWPLAQMIYNINNSPVPLLIGPWVENLLEINHCLNLFLSRKGLTSFSKTPLFENIHFIIYCNLLCEVYIVSFSNWGYCLQWAEINHCKSPLLTTKLLTGSLQEWHLNLPGAPAGARTWHLLDALGAKCWVVMLMVGAFELYVEGIVTWCLSPLPFPTVALNHHSAAPLAN